MSNRVRLLLSGSGFVGIAAVAAAVALGSGSHQRMSAVLYALAALSAVAMAALALIDRGRRRPRTAHLRGTARITSDALLGFGQSTEERREEKPAGQSRR